MVSPRDIWLGILPQRALEEAAISTTGETAIMTADDATSKSYEWEDPVQPSVALVEAVAAETDRETVHMPPLYECINPEALDALLTTRTAGPNEQIGVSFVYDAFHVWLGSSGRIELRPTVTDRD